MFTLSSILYLFTIVVVFVIAARYINRAMAEKGIPGGMVRGVLVCFLAAVLALFAGAAVDWISEPAPSAVQEMK
jgi:predicted PurR-regulated permease PerM